METPCRGASPPEQHQDLRQEETIKELEGIRTVAIVLSNLCQLLIVAIGENLYSEGYHTGNPTAPTPPHDPGATASAPQNPGESPVPHPKTSDDDVETGDE